MEVSKKPLEIDDDDDDIDNHGNCPTESSMEMPPQQFTDSDIPGYSEFVESDYDLKVINHHSFFLLLFVPLFLIRTKENHGYFIKADDLILFQDQSIDMLSDDDEDCSEISSSSSSALNPSEVKGAFSFSVL